MKALQMVGVDQPMELRDVPKPRIREDVAQDDHQAIVKVRACGLCGTDLHHLQGTAEVGTLPVTLGHEIAGEVAEVGPAVAAGGLEIPRLQPGDPVVVHYVIYCGSCPACRRGRYNFCHNQQMLGRDVDGGLAEYVKVPARNLVPLPASISFAEGAIMGCAVATAFHALILAQLSIPESVVVWGTGGVGLSLVHLCGHVSAAYPIIAVGREAKPLELARRLGADETINVTAVDPVARIHELTEGEGADCVFDTAGITEVGRTGSLITLESLCAGGQLIVVATYGHPIQLKPHDELGIFEKRFTGSCGNLPNELHQLVRVVAERRRVDLRKLISRRIKLEEVNGVVDRWQKRGGIARAVVEF